MELRFVYPDPGCDFMVNCMPFKVIQSWPSDPLIPIWKYDVQSGPDGVMPAPSSRKELKLD
jgi:hypothetical protein